MLKIAILGAGGLGCAVTLELAKAGHGVDLYERREDILLGATRINEGKIHQGLIYAKDDPQVTARAMASGAVDFQDDLARWIDVPRVIKKSTPFIYAVHRQSQLTAAHISTHFEQCCQILNDLSAAKGRTYLGSKEQATFRPLKRSELKDHLDDTYFQAAFETTEYAVDPRPICDALAANIRAAPRVQIQVNAAVCAVRQRDDGRYVVETEDGVEDGPYDHIVNSTWEGRLRIDASIGMAPPKTYSIRHKFGHRVSVKLTAKSLPSVTTVLGPFGDIVNFGDSGFFLSWYPRGMIEMTKNKGIAPNWHSMTCAQRLENYRHSADVWMRHCPALKDIAFPDSAIDPRSGLIYALGDTDIDDAESHLHTRSDVGIQSVGGYHTVNTGKFTLFPQMAMALSRRILN